MKYLKIKKEYFFVFIVTLPNVSCLVNKDFPNTFELFTTFHYELQTMLQHRVLDF